MASEYIFRVSLLMQRSSFMHCAKKYIIACPLLSFASKEKLAAY